MKKPHTARDNWKDTQPPPSVADLQFQAVQFDTRLGGASTAPRLSPQAYKNYFRDNSLSWELGQAISGAGKVLREETE